VPPDNIATTFRNLELVFSVGAGSINSTSATPAASSARPHAGARHRREHGRIRHHGRARLHRDLLHFIAQQRAGLARDPDHRPQTSSCRRDWGSASSARPCSTGSRRSAFRLLGWNRSPREVRRRHLLRRYAALPEFLAQTDILVCLLPLTDETRGILNADLFARLPRGAKLVNVGRGGHLIEADLLDALERGVLSNAVLDVAEQEPLPAGHPFWSHPKILLTPHIASMTTPETAVEFVLDVIARHRRGETLPGLVDRQTRLLKVWDEYWPKCT
jgi:glyoxylate/hydroxypyruvate reductase A